MIKFKTIYLVVEVTFDFYRFQNNIAAFYDKKMAKDFLKTIGNKLPILEYDEKKALQEESDKKRGCNHIWLQRMKVPVVKKEKPVKKAKVKKICHECSYWNSTKNRKYKCYTDECPAKQRDSKNKK